MRKFFFAILCLPLFCFASGLLDKESKPKKELTELFVLLEGEPAPQSLKEMVEVAEKKWRQPNKERWRFETRYPDKAKSAEPLLRALGLIEESHAIEQFYDYVLVLGALTRTMEQRLDFLANEWRRGVRFNQLILLTGQRDLNANEPKIEGVATETEMFMFLYEKLDCLEMKKVPLIVVDTPKHLDENNHWQRPGTKETIEHWLLQKPMPGKCLAISNYPYTGYQHAVLFYTLPRAFQIETIGFTAREDLPLEIHLDNIARCLKIYLDTRMTILPLTCPSSNF